MCYKRSLRGRNEGGRDQFYRRVRQDSPEDVINGRQKGVCPVAGRLLRRGVREYGAGCSRQRRLCTQSPRQKMDWCFLEIEGNNTAGA